MKNYQGQLDSLFGEWRQKAENDGFYRFCEDGLMYKGEFDSKVGEDGKTYWWRCSGNEDLMWEEYPKRIMFLTKDVPNEDNADLREWIFRQNPTNIKVLIYKNISLWLYGLLHINENGEAPAYDEINDTSLFSPFIDKTPIAYVNVKKESGKSTIDNKTLQNHMNNYKDFIVKEIEILEPDIIVCGGGSSAIKNFVNKNLYPNLKQINSWMYYEEEKNILVIDSYHPSYFRIKGGGKTIYTKMMEAYEEFLAKHPKFNGSCREN